MGEATCRTCPFWALYEASESVAGPPRREEKGYCRLGPPRLRGELAPSTPGTWWCSEHPLRQRDRLAAMAMQGMLAASPFFWDDETRTCGIPFRDVIAVNAYEIADAMLAARASVSGGEKGGDHGE